MKEEIQSVFIINFYLLQKDEDRGRRSKKDRIQEKKVETQSKSASKQNKKVALQVNKVASASKDSSAK